MWGRLHTATERKRKEHMCRQWDHFASFQTSDIFNKEPSYENSALWDRQTDRGQTLPARQASRPRRVGSLQDDSFINRETGTHTHAHTHTITHIHTHGISVCCSNLKTFLIRGKYVYACQTVRTCLKHKTK